MTFPDTVYRRLADALDGVPPGFAETESGVELRLLACFYEPEQAAIASAMLPIPEPAAGIAARAGVRPDEARQMLQRMAAARLIAATEGEGETLYSLMPFMGGVFEEQVHLLDAETAELFEEYFVATQGVVSHESPSFHRVIPVEQAVPSGIEIYPYEQTVEILRAAKSWAVRPCLCRVQQRLVGKGCDRPTGNCVVFAPVEGAFEEGGADRPISLDEALRLIREAAGLGLVHTLPNYQRGYDYVCSCCTCCCLNLRALAEFDVPTAVARSGFRVRVDSELCEGCGDCVERCQFQALSISDDVSVVDYNRCLGCGSCTTVCPEDALLLERRPDGEVSLPPTSRDDWTVQRAADRGTGVNERRP